MQLKYNIRTQKDVKLMGYFSRLAVELLERNQDRELDINYGEEVEPKTNQELAALQQEEQHSLWNEEYRKQLEQRVAKEQPKVYKKNKRFKINLFLLFINFFFY